ncbi:MAG: hypothetical protein IT168_07335 [Bryobacterales bacterium]|nr:hypothetical protein [Bryobacterales bacterium]
MSPILLAVIASVPLSVHFEPNRGQAPSGASYIARVSGNSPIGISATRVSLPGLAFRFLNSRTGAIALAGKPLPSYSNYLYAERRLTAVPHFAELRFQGIYPGIDAVYYARNDQLEYDLLVAPQADTSRVRMRFDRDHKLELLPSGDLAVDGKPVLAKPAAFQDGRPVPVRFRLHPGNELSFELGRYDRRRPLRIDPVFVYSLPVGGTLVATDAQGNGYFAGQGSESGLAGTPGTFQPLEAGDQDVFVSKVDPSGNLIFSTYWGTGLTDRLAALALDAAGNIYIAGDTQNRISLSSADLFVVKLSSDGKTLMMSTTVDTSIPGGYFSIRDTLSGMAIDQPSGSVYLAGNTNEDIPGAVPAGRAHITKLTAAGVVQGRIVLPLTLSSLGQIAVHASGDVFATGSLSESTLPPTPGTVGVKTSESRNAFVARIRADLSGVSAVAWLGGTGNSDGTEIAVGPSGDVYVAGYTAAPDFPTTAGAFERTLRGSQDGFVAKLCPDLTCFRYSTLIGGTARDGIFSLAVTAKGEAAIGGATDSADFPLFEPVQSTSTIMPAFRRVSGFGSSITGLTDPQGSVNLISVNPKNQTQMLAMDPSRGKLYRTTDGAQSWTEVLSSPTRALARSSSDPNIVYHSGFALSRSTDGGATWVTLNTDDRPTSLAVDASNPNLVHRVFGGAYARSVDGGQTFAVQGVPIASVSAVYAHETIPKLVFVATFSGDLLRSTDGGLTFTTLRLPDPVPVTVSSLAVHPLNANLIYVVQRGRLYRSINAGGAFTTLPLDSALSVAVAPSDTSVVYCSAGGKLLVSRNGGDSWDQVDRSVAAFAVSPTEPATYFAYGVLSNGFLALLNPSGAALQFSTYLGSSARDIAADGDGNLLVTGGTDQGFPMTGSQFTQTPTRYGAKIAPATPACSFTVGPASVFLYGGGKTSVSIVAPSGCAWTASSSAAWLTVPASGNGPGSIEVRAEPNTGPARTGSVTIANQVVTITQAGFGCGFRVSPDTAEQTVASGATIRFAVEGSPNCPWAVDSPLPPWITANRLSGTGPGTIDLALSPSPQPQTRSASLSIAGRSVYLSQDGLCTTPLITIGRTGFPVFGGDTTLNIQTGTMCSWSLTEEDQHRVVLRSESGTGPARLTVRMDANPSTSVRQRTVFVRSENAWANFEVYQPGRSEAARLPRSVIRKANGDFEVHTYGSPTPLVVGGAFAVSYAAAQDGEGNVFIAALDRYGALILNRYAVGNSSWAGWTRIGGVFQGVPAIATYSTSAYIVARDSYNGYWTMQVRDSLTVSDVRNIGGIFSSDPAISLNRSGGVTIVGKDTWNSLWAWQPYPGTWTYIGAIVKGKPSVTVGYDDAAYIAVRDSWDSLWMGRWNGTDPPNWRYLGGVMSQDPIVTSLREGSIVTAIRSTYSTMWLATVQEGVTPPPVAWTFIGGVLDTYGAGAHDSSLYLAGKDQWNNLWWYRTVDNSWTFSGGGGALRGAPAVTPQ